MVAAALADLADLEKPQPEGRRRRQKGPVAVNTSSIQHQQWGSVVKVLPGGYYVGFGEEKIMTVLGSCVTACIRDPQAGVGGMNHFMLPMPDLLVDGDRHLAARYGSYAMELLINEILKRGGEKSRLEVKLFGGGNMLPALCPVGVRNIQFVKSYLAVEGLEVQAEDLGLSCARKVIYDIRTGRAKVKHLGHEEKNLIDQRDQLHRDHLIADADYGSIELF